MTITTQLAAFAGIANVTIVDNAAWVFGADYMVAARATRRAVIWEVTDMDAQEEIGGTFSTARAAIDFALARGPIA